MAHNNDPMAYTQATGIQGNPPRPSPIESCILQIHNVLNSTLQEISSLRQSHNALEARVISIQNDTNRPDERQGEPSFVVNHLREKKKKEPKKQYARVWADGSLILISIPPHIVRRLHMSVEN